jgi:predicted PurR-regulated permease PerM
VGVDQRANSNGLERGVIIGETPADALEASGADTGRTWADVPWRTILASVGVVLATFLLVRVVLLAVDVITWVVIAGFFAIVLAPATRAVQERVGGRRNLATGIVVFSTLAAVLGTLTLFLLPVRTQLIAIFTDLPGTVNDAAAGKGPVGRLVTQLHLTNLVNDHEAELTKAANDLSSSSFHYATVVFSALLAFVTITVLAFLFLSQSEAMGAATLELVPHRRRESVRQTAIDAARAVSGYMVGNLLISLIAGSAALVCLLVLGVPSPVVLALWVAFADLIPLIGATLGAAVAVTAAFLHSPAAGFISLAFFIVYQQIENSAIYPSIMARRVKINPLIVLLSVLVSVAVFGFVGAVLAVPVSGAIQVAIKAVRSERQRERLVLPDAATTAAGPAG